MTGSRPRRPGRALLGAVAALAVALAALAAGSGSASAAGGDALQIRRVDTTSPERSVVQYLSTADGDDAEAAVLAEGGEPVGDGGQQLPDSTPIAVALVFDTASAMDDTGALVAAKEAASEWLQGRSEAEKANQLVGVFAASDVAVRVQDFSSDTARVLEAIDRVAPTVNAEATEKSALWGAVTLAANGLAEHERHQANVVVMTATGNNVGPSSERSLANGALAHAGASLFAVELLGHGLDSGPLDGLVRANGGLVYTTDRGTELGELVEQAGAAIDEGQYALEFEPRAELGAVADLTLTVADATASASVVVGSNVVGASSLTPSVSASGGGVSLLQGPLGLALLVVAALVAGVALTYGVVMIFVREDRLSVVLKPYDEALASPVVSGADDDDPTTSLARTALVQRAVQLTEQVAEQRGMLTRAETALERANLPLRAGEALFFYAALVVVATLLSLVLTSSVLLGLIVGGLAALVPVATVSFLAARRRKEFMALLPDTLSLLAGTLRAGYSLMQGVEAVSQEVAEPMGLELRRVVTEARLGRPLEEALEGTAERMASPDFAWAVMAIRIQREVGGNLSELLLTVADTMVARERLRRDVAALTAEGRVSAAVLGFLPVAMGAVLFVVNKEYTSRLLNTTLGNVMLGLAVVAILIGFAWMKKIINIKI